MIREMKLETSLSPGRKVVTNRDSSKNSLALSPKSLKSPIENFERLDSESTFYNTVKGKNGKFLDKTKEDPILENLKNFVQTSSSLKTMKTPMSSSVVFTSKDYLKSNSNLFNSMIEKGKKRNTTRSSSLSKIYSSFNKDDHGQSHGI